MDHFKINYDKINYPIDSPNKIGLRNAQLGAIHSIGAHFTMYQNEPAQIIMPTGSGKTAVLNLSAYLLRAKRVLVISSSIMVRGQIFEEFSTLKTLKKIGVFSEGISLPNVKEIKSPIKSIQEWEDLENYNVIVGIPKSINEGINETIFPDKNLFDLILVDEAHHVPAYTWSNVVEHFAQAQKIFFTATPFRRDKKEIKGRVVFNYPLSKAYEDKIFGDIGYYPVITTNSNQDLAIALEAEKIFNRDKESGYNHALMVRTDTKKHATELAQIYEANTNLKLKKIDSSLSHRTIKTTLKKLRLEELDGIICVDMLGEGFDFPNLKIAAIHSPKKSLANTLQFIGRFARTNAKRIDKAKFIAVPNDILIGTQKLYQEGAIWNDIIKNLSEETIDYENELKKISDSFDKKIAPTIKENISFYNLNPYCHVKIYKTDGVNLSADIQINGQEIIFQATSIELNTAVYIFRETVKPKWIVTDSLIDINHFFLLVYFDSNTKLLFIHSSIKTDQFYQDIIDSFALGLPEKISKYQINKVLVDIKNPEFFNIGMQNRTVNSGESYRTITGSNAENAIRKRHGKNYANGHVFMKGIDNEKNVTIGYSTGSKVWSNAYKRIPDYIKWCKKIGSKIISTKKVVTNTGFDNLPIGEIVSEFPYKILGTMWHKDTYLNAPFIYRIDEDELIEPPNQLLDYEIIIDYRKTDKTQVAFSLELNDEKIPLTYNFSTHYNYEVTPLVPNLYSIAINGRYIDLITYLNENSLAFILDDFAMISNHEYFPPPDEKEFQYDSSKIESFNWEKWNTDIKKEFYENPSQDKVNNGDRNSIHDTLENYLTNQNYNVLIYDHGTGEVADFITLKDDSDKVEINLHHVKGSGGTNPGDRVNDVYEVCMQVVKSQVWTPNKKTFCKKIISRTKDKDEKFLIGDVEIFKNYMNQSKKFVFIFTVIQPGISETSISAKISYVLAATDDSLITNGYSPLKVIGS
ncbi:DEAD/DEAH box helicase [Aureispira sp. CCB-QB1]|uniref:DEAD/DEAH box helicase n=1 Tax=Aureispira sp. CCB-QB1 TaxID=1313421 RepID=UPI0006981756|nr:DEAD/DEAH box helicase family protein [Aureispira sp. CCB-QB1]